MIYVLDTSVLSEVMREAAHPSVVAWLRACPPEAMFTTAISQSEILYGIRLLAAGSKRSRLEHAAQAMFDQEFAGRVLPFDADAAEIYAELRVHRRVVGQPISAEDGMIAAITRARRATVVTRDAGGFVECGVTSINPWTAS